MMAGDADALVIGGGPAGSATAILLAAAGWKVILVEQHDFPRQKVCGECISAGSLTLLDELGIGTQFREIAGPELRQVGWIGSTATLVADFPRCRVGQYSYGRAVGRDRLDALLVQRARALGVDVMQPAKVRSLRGGPGGFDCGMRVSASEGSHPRLEPIERTRRARVVVDAHGSWEPGPDFSAVSEASPSLKEPMDASDLFAFKASFKDSALAPGLLPVIAFRGGYGGIVVADAGRTTLACCIRRDTLRTCRASMPGAPAGEAVAAYLRRSCRGIENLIGHSHRDGAWLSVGPIRPGVRVDAGLDVFRVGNAAGETHPLIGEGISMALQSAQLLARHLLAQAPDSMDLFHTRAINRRYAAAWRSAFAPRLRWARTYAQAAMRPELTVPVHALLRRWPSLLTRAAQWAGKAQTSVQLN